ncbi:fasciclin-2 isoform X2 [Leptopilina boulardi]|uniref:fasciclin-2 isoform X2 n=1 Tax=Leptopilina boulardi TaxID=63433 RepID=UPI0021F5C94A|nr:fasciclin-2 isoform X2 [Leptopilina boulardi]
MAVFWYPAAAVILVLLHLTGYSNGESRLEILPNGEVQSKPVGSSIILTCKPNVTNPELISNMEWIDHNGRVIDSLNRQGSVKSTMYTEKRHGQTLALLFTNLQTQQGGMYKCRATFANNEELVKEVSIVTIVAITWSDAPENQYPILGEDFNVRCKVVAQPSPTVDWLFNGELIETNEHYIIETHSLKLKKVTELDDGIYTCRAFVATTGELKERNIRVEVHIKPQIEDSEETTIEAIEGDTADIVCKARGKPPPEFSWVKTITYEDLSKADRFGVNNYTGVMTIKNVNREDDGEYRCSAQNAAGRADWNIRLNVIVKPKIMEFINKTSPVMKQVRIECRAFGRPPPEIVFRKHTSDKRFELGAQRDMDRIKLENRKDDRNGETVGVLIIDNVIRSDDGLYECIGINKGGESIKNGHLTVEFPPTFEVMDNRTIFAWNNHPGNLTCIATSIPNATIEWRAYGNIRLESNAPHNIIGKGPISTLIVEPRDQRYFTTYRCVATNIHGSSEYPFVVKEGKRPGFLLQVRISEMTATTATFEILLPAYNDELPIKTVNIQYKLADQSWTHALNRTWAVNSTYIIENLRPQTTYEFRFAASNDAGLATWGNELTESTLDRSRPGVPKIRSQISRGMEYETSPFSNQYEVSWVVPVDNGEQITNYEIKYCQLKRISGDWEEVSGTCRNEEERGKRTTYWLKHLYSDTYYKVEVRARNFYGLSDPGEIKIKTNRGNDSPVVHHRGALISSGAIIGIVIAILVVIIIIIDVICCCAQKTGIIFYVCERSRRKPMDEEDVKLGSLYGWRFPLPYCDQKMANVAGVTAIQDSGSGKSTIRLVKHTAIDEKEPLREEKKITPIIDSGLRRETSITFDGKRSISKTGFVGKDSAV